MVAVLSSKHGRAYPMLIGDPIFPLPIKCTVIKHGLAWPILRLESSPNLCFPYFPIQKFTSVSSLTSKSEKSHKTMYRTTKKLKVENQASTSNNLTQEKQRLQIKIAKQEN